MDQFRRLPFIVKAYSVTLVVLFLVSITFKKGDDVLFVNSHHSFFLDEFFKVITGLGDGVIFILLLLITLFIRFQYALIGAVACVVHGLLVSLFKRVLLPDAGRPRSYISNDLLHFIPGVNVHSLHSFPSGHTATAFCAALLIALIFKNKIAGILTLLLACLVAYSRVYLLQHFLMDVMVGALIGCFTSAVCWQIFTAMQKQEWMSRRLSLKTQEGSLSLFQWIRQSFYKRDYGDR